MPYETFFLGRRNQPRGVTLLEVLIAMGIMAVGLLGMAALIPLGRMELAEGNRLDNVSSIGRAAFRDLSVRGYLRPEMWANPIDGKSILPLTDFPNEYSLTPNTATARQFISDSGTEGIKGPPFAPLVIDPLMIAPKFFQEPTNANTLTSAEETHRERCSVFPYSTRLNGWDSGWPEESAPRIARVTLRTVPAHTAGKMGQTKFLSTTMKYDVASRFFRSSDDLTIDVPTDKTLKPVQVFAVTSNSLSNVRLVPGDGDVKEKAINQVAYRKFRGDYSWFLVVEPSLSEAYWNVPESMPIVGGPNASLLAAKQFRVWTVVCYKRDLRDTSEMDMTRNRDVGERMVWVDFIDRNTARLRIAGADRATAMNVLRLKTNQWFAAVGSYSEPALGGGTRYIMEWYRIINVAENVESVKDDSGNDTSNWFREVTLVGRDFSNLGFEFFDSNAFSYQDIAAVARSAGAGTAEPLTAWGILVEGARGVYEKTIYVDRPSSWSME